MIKIYVRTNKINGMSYVGQTSQRLTCRAWGKGKGYARLKYFGPAIEEYGWENFESEILTETDDPEYANLLEWFYTIEFNTQWPNGYNSSIGRKNSEEQKRKVSEANKGRFKSEEVREKIRRKLIGRPSPLKGIPSGRTPMLGKHHSEEVRRRMSEAHKGRVIPEEQRRRQSESLKGRIWINDGTIEKLSSECPEGFVPGRLPFHRHN